MKITVLDRNSIGTDTPLEGLYQLGEIEVYDSTDGDDVYERVADADVLILNKVKITERVLDAAKKLKLICIFATGYDNIDIKAAKERNIAVCNVPGYSTDSVALFTVATVLSLITHLREYNDYVRSGDYTKFGLPNRLVPVYHEIKGKTWGIIGLGNIGKAVARVAEALGARVIANKRTPDPDYECVDIDTLCRESDIITIHCPLNDGTRGLIDEKRIALMKRDVVIINEARGAVVNEHDIARAIKKGTIGAFGSDVYSTEPFANDHPFYEIKDKYNVLFTPHAAWGSFESRLRCISIICDNIKAYLNGEKYNRVD
jgi:glycerate dehydrogenase